MKEFNFENIRSFFEEQKHKNRGKEKYISGDAEFSFMGSTIEVELFSDGAINVRFRVRQDDILVFSECILFRRIEELDASYFVRELVLEIGDFIIKRHDEIKFLEKLMCGITDGR